MEAKNPLLPFPPFSQRGFFQSFPFLVKKEGKNQCPPFLSFPLLFGRGCLFLLPSFGEFGRHNHFPLFFSPERDGSPSCYRDYFREENAAPFFLTTSPCGSGGTFRSMGGNRHRGPRPPPLFFFLGASVYTSLLVFGERRNPIPPPFFSLFPLPFCAGSFGYTQRNTLFTDRSNGV